MYFEDSASSVVDSWLNAATGIGSAQTTVASANKKKVSEVVPDTSIVAGRAGIGFTHAKKRDTDRPSVFDNAIKKSLKRKSQKDLEDSRTDVYLHGVEEEDFGKLKQSKLTGPVCIYYNFGVKIRYFICLL